MPVVTTVTARAISADDLGDADYREIYAELRGKTTLRKFASFIESQYSFAWWSKYERGKISLTHQARQELRRAIGLPELPLTVAEATAAVDPDATVYRVDDEPPIATADRVVLVAVPGPISLYLNGDLQIGEIVADDPAPKRDVTGVTRRRARKVVSIRPTTWVRLNGARKAAGKTWDEFLSELIEGQS